MSFSYGSICSGIEAASEAWKPLGWKPTFFSEIDTACRAVLKHHHPKVKLYGDFTKIQADESGIDVLVGGTPCQSFSVAGLRGGLDDDRGNLALEFLRLVDRIRPCWVVFENVPGLLSSVSHVAPSPCEPPSPMDMERDGQEMETEDEYDSEELHAFNCFLAGLAELGYGFSYRVLDAQYAGVPQRRRRVFVVGYFGDWRRAAAVLFERQSLSGYPPPSRKAGQDVAPTISARTKGSGGLGTDFDCDGGLVVPPLTGNPYGDHESREGLLTVTHALRAGGFDASEDGTGRGTPLVPVAYPIDLRNALRDAEKLDEMNRQGCGIGNDGDPSSTLSGSFIPGVVAFSCKDHGADAGELSPTLRAMEFDGSHANGGGQVAVAFQSSQSGVREVEAHATLDSNNGSRRHGVMQGSAVRRLTPLECCRLQGFPDNFFDGVLLRGKPLADGPKYKMLGNSMAVPVVRWIGERIQSIEARV